MAITTRQIDWYRHGLDLSKASTQITDIYLLGLAHENKGRLVTFDRAIPLQAVVDAKPNLLHIINA